MIFQHSRFIPRNGNFGGRTQRRSGFTLIELLVVIAIIALLAAILFPVFSRARENARKSSCANNLKQIGLGIYQYLQDYDEYYMPPQPLTASTPGAGATFMTLAMPYVKNPQVFVCPSGSRTPATAAMGDGKDYFWRAPAPPWRSASEGGYGVNINVIGTFTPAFHMSDATQPTTTALAFDCGWYSGSSPLFDVNVYGAARHLDGINYAYMDGHVKWLKVRDGDLTKPNFNP